MVSEGEVEAAVVDIMGGPWVWGQSDCCASACDVFAALHGIDPMAPLRGRYATAREAALMIASYGGWRAMCAALARDAGLREGTGGAGDLGLVRTEGRLSLAVGWGGGLWAGRTDGGFVTVTGAVQSWRR